LCRSLSQAPIAYIDIRFFNHATEDPNKVIEAVHNVLPINYVDNITFTRRNLRGHFGNPITLFEARIMDKKTIKAFVENLSAHLNDSDKETLRKEIDKHVEKGSLYVRLDKQAALHGELKTCTADPIRVRLRFKKANIREIIKICQELNLLKHNEG